MSDVPPPPGMTPPPMPASSPPPPPPPPTLTPVTPPPGYVAYGTSPTPFAALRRVGGLSKAIVIFTVIAAIGTLVTTIVTASVAQDAKNYLSGELSDDEFRSALNPLNGAQLITGIASLTVFVLTVIWMYRIASNIRAFQRRTTWSPLFAIFGWVLPPLLYIIPALMLRELWKGSDPSHPDDPEGWRSGGDNPLVWVWFALYSVVPIVLGFFSVNSFLDGGFSSNGLDSLAESLDNFDVVSLISMLVGLGAAVAWIMLVRRLTARHRQLTNER